MCILCEGHGRKIGQFRQALSQPLDRLSTSRIETALRELQDNPPACSEVDVSIIVRLESRRIQAALDALALSDLRKLVKEMEEETPKPDG